MYTYINLCLGRGGGVLGLVVLAVDVAEDLLPHELWSYHYYYDYYYNMCIYIYIYICIYIHTHTYICMCTWSSEEGEMPAVPRVIIVSIVIITIILMI